MNIRTLLVAVIVATGLIFQASVSPAAAKDPISTGFLSSLAVSGYDPVAYFTAGKPVEGRGNHEYEWNGATWRFSSAENLSSFKSDPEAYAPQYGGYCAWAVSQGYTASSDPQAWRIVDGKLYLNYSKGVQKTWAQDVPGNIAKGDANWPKVLDK
jgi:YHS domain-containing protein